MTRTQILASQWCPKRREEILKGFAALFTGGATEKKFKTYALSAAKWPNAMLAEVCMRIYRSREKTTFPTWAEFLRRYGEVRLEYMQTPEGKAELEERDRRSRALRLVPEASNPEAEAIFD